MGLELKNVIPWGRSMQEYIRMFALTPDELHLAILDCAGGPASFNTEMTRKGYTVISCDPLYHFSVSAIAQRIQETYPTVINGIQPYLDKFVWQEIPSPTQLGEVRMAAMQQFLEDLPLGIQQKRYLTDELPVLSFSTNQFNLALCSHLLFTYSHLLSQDFHLASILEMCRVAREVRIFPLLNLAGDVSPALEPVMRELAAQGYNVEIKQVSYEFQKGGNQLLKVVKPHAIAN